MKKLIFIILILLFAGSYSFADDMAYSDMRTRSDRIIHGRDLSELWSVTPKEVIEVDVEIEEPEQPEIDVSDIRKEIQWLRDELNDLRKEKVKGEQDYKFGGSFEMRSRFGNVVSYNSSPRGTIGPEGNYRLIFTYFREFGENADFVMKLDTMDGGFDSLTLRDMVTRQIDLEGNLLADLGLDEPVRIKASFGPGDIVHRDTGGIVPSEDYRVYRRAFPSFVFGTELGGFDVSASYIARSIKPSGEIGTTEVGVEVRRGLGDFNVVGETEYFLKPRVFLVDILDPPSSSYDTFFGLGFRFKQSENMYEEIFFDSGSSPMNAYYFSGKMVIEKMNTGKTDLLIDIHNAGSSYRKPFISGVFMPLNIFDKYVLNDSIDIGVGITHRISNRFSLAFRSDLVLKGNWQSDSTTAGTSFTNEIGFSNFLMKDLMLAGSYRVYNVPSGTGQFGSSVPKVSDLFSFSLIYLF
ncbi:hypothetical protein ACFLZ2_02380 [Candidatus Margulisiibacteriota bacterium]